MTAIITITATQIPAMVQMYSAEVTQMRSAERARLIPIIELVSKDEQLNLDEKLFVIDFISRRGYGSGSVEDAIKNYKAKIKQRQGDEDVVIHTDQ